MADYTVNPLEMAGWVVYINGLEIPVSGLTVQYGIWEPPTLTLNMIPHTILTRLGAEDRIQVAVFYLDHHWDPTSPTFCLLGEFEVVGWSYNNTPRGRFIQLNCVSQLQILQQLKFFYISSMDDIAQALAPVTSTDPSVFSTTKVLYPASLFLEGLTQNEGPDQYIKRPIEFVLNVFRALLRPVQEGTDSEGSTTELPPAAASVPGKNFFARWMKMTGFHRRWAALPILEDNPADGCFPLIKSVQDTNTLLALQQQVGQTVGNAGSAWDLMKQVLGYMYMEVASLPAPPAARIAKESGKIVEPAFPGADESGTMAAIPTHFVKPMCTFGLPPVCNMVFPSMMQNYTFAENYMEQPTRLYLNESFVADLITSGQHGPNSTLVKSLMVTGYPYEVRQRLKDTRGTSPQDNTKNMLLFPEEFYKGPVTQRMNAPPWMHMLEQQYKASAESKTVVDDAIETASELFGDREPSSLGALFDTYAAYEFWRARYAARNGGVTMAWNPYIVPGFPGMVFDQENAGFDTMSYITRVVHTMSATTGPQMTTQATFSFGRTLTEFAANQGEQVADFENANPYAEFETKYATKGLKTTLRSRFGQVTLGTDQVVNPTEFNKVCTSKTTRETMTMNPRLLDMLQHIGNNFDGRTITIVSGFRPQNNPPKKKTKGQHAQGNAVDINISGVPRSQLWLFCYDAFPNDGIGYYPNSNHIHIDCRGTRARWVHTEGIGESNSAATRMSAAEIQLLYKQLRSNGGAAGRETTTASKNEAPSEHDASTGDPGPSTTYDPQTVSYGVRPKPRDIGPTEVIPEVADAFQSLVSAQELYNRLFYRNTDLDRAAVFNWKDMLKVTGHFGEELDLENDEWKLDAFSTMKPRDETKPLFESRDAAMRYIARPVCTLQEYIETWHKKDLETLKQEKTVRGEYTSFYSPTNDGNKKKGAVFWGRIYSLTQGPGAKPGIEVTNVGAAPDYAPAGAAGFQFVGPEQGIPQTRDNWATRLEEYRKIIRSEFGKIAPQG